MSKKKTFKITLTDTEADLLSKAKKAIDPDNVLPIEIYVEDVIHKCLQRHFNKDDNPEKSLYSLFLGDEVVNNPFVELSKMFKDQKIEPQDFINFIEDMGQQYNFFEEMQETKAKKETKKQSATEQEEKEPKAKKVVKKFS